MVESNKPLPEAALPAGAVSATAEIVRMSQAIETMPSGTLVVNMVQALADAIADEAISSGKVATAPLTGSLEVNALLQKRSRRLVGTLIGPLVTTRHVLAGEMSREEEREVNKLIPWIGRMNRTEEFYKGGMATRFSRPLHFFTYAPEGQRRRIMNLAKDAEIAAAFLEVEAIDVMEAAASIHEIASIEYSRIAINHYLADVLQEDNAALDRQAAEDQAREFLQTRKKIINPYDPKDKTYIQARLLKKLYSDKDNDVLAALQNTGRKSFYVIEPEMTFETEESELPESCYYINNHIDGNPGKRITVRAGLSAEDLPTLAQRFNQARKLKLETNVKYGKASVRPATEGEKWQRAAKLYDSKWRGKMKHYGRAAFDIGYTTNETRTWVAEDSGSGKLTCYSFVCVAEDGDKLVPEKCTAFGAHYLVDDVQLEGRLASLGQGMRKTLRDYCLQQNLYLSHRGYESKTLATAKRAGLMYKPSGWESHDLLYGPTRISSKAVKAMSIALEPYGLNYKAALDLAAMLTFHRAKMMPFARNCVARTDGGRLSVIPAYIEKAEDFNLIYKKMLTGEPTTALEQEIFGNILLDYQRQRRAEVANIKNKGFSIFDQTAQTFGWLREALNQDVIKTLPDRWMRALKSVTSTPLLLSSGETEELADIDGEYAWIGGCTPALTEDLVFSSFVTRLANGDLEIYYRGKRDMIEEWSKVGDPRQQEEYFTGLRVSAQRVMKEIALQLVLQNQAREQGSIKPLVDPRKGTICYLDSPELLIPKKTGLSVSQANDVHDWARLESWAANARLVKTKIPRVTLQKYQELSQPQRQRVGVKEAQFYNSVGRVIRSFIDQKLYVPAASGRQYNGFYEKLFAHLVGWVGQNLYEQLFKTNQELGIARASVFADLLLNFGPNSLKLFYPTGDRPGLSTADYLTLIMDCTHAFEAVMQTVE